MKSHGLTFFEIAVFGAGCINNTMAGNPHPESMFYELAKGEQTDYGTYTSKRTGVIQSQSEYNKTLVQYTASPPDSLDFDAGTVLLVDLGKRGSGGYSVEVSSVDVADDHVTALERVPR